MNPRRPTPPQPRTVRHLYGQQAEADFQTLAESAWQKQNHLP